MGLASTVGSVVGLALLALAALATILVGVVAAQSLLWGLTSGRFLTIWFAAGFALTTGFTGYVIRKRIAGNVLPLDYDISVAFRGGQGGL
ncbi:MULTISPECIES: hypothetical protein [Halobacterium]|uniref:hypothetical protein n=1 Tax=Halobacterium TaxID=2239 RepID=UPI00073F8159|nr:MULTISPECIES: hypothetical protein [Halobacterium]MCG1003218.1 hypothetical protein [Halobacterium noricense]